MVFMLDDHLHYEHWIASKATDFITKSVDNNEPFFAWVSFQGPHTPYNPPKGVKGKVDVDKLPPPVDRPEGETLCPTHVYRTAYLPILQDPEEVLRERIAYAESIANIDNQVGCLLGQLEELGIVDQTLIIRLGNQ